MQSNADYQQIDSGGEGVQTKKFEQKLLEDENREIDEASKLLTDISQGIGQQMARFSVSSSNSADAEQIEPDEVKAIIAKIEDQLEKLQHVQDMKFKLAEAAEEEKKFAENKDAMNQRLTEIQKEQKRTEHLVWEPHGAKERLKSIYHNTFESLYILLIGWLCLLHSSIVGVGFLMMSISLLFTMTMGQERRYFWGMIIAATIQVTIIIIMVWKIVSVKKMVHSTDDKDIFIANVKYYECLGFDLVYNPTYLSHVIPPAGESYTIENAGLLSFIAELVTTFLTLNVLYYFYKQQKTVNFFLLKGPQTEDETREEQINKNKEDIMRLKQLEAKYENKEYDIKETKEKKVHIGTKGAYNTAKQEKKIEEQEKKDLKDLKKRIRKNFVDSDHFYQLNRKFFMLTLLFQLFEAMAFNSCSDIPALFMILLLLAFYAFRKKYSIHYRQYSFFVIYFIQVNLLLKLIFQSVVRIDFIREGFSSKSNQDRIGVKFLNLWFGGVPSDLSEEDFNQYMKGKWQQIALIYVCLFTSFSWKATKWVEIRYKTMDMQDKSFVTRFNTYFRKRESQDQAFNFNQAFMKSEFVDRDLKKKIKKEKKPAKVHYKYDTGGQNQAKSAGKDLTKYLPLIVIWTARFNMFILSYMYHTEVSFVNVMWVIMSFWIEDETFLLMSSVIMTPILSWQFTLIYGSRIPIVNDTYFFKTYGEPFIWKMQHQMLEQSFMYITLVLFYMMISCHSLLSQNDKENILIKFFKKRVADPRFSNNWKLVFFSFRYIQAIVLMTLFLKGISNINNLKNLGFMIFFVVYTAYEQIYRKTSILLIFFISFFIAVQYYYSLFWQIDSELGRVDKMKGFRWSNIIPYQNSIDDPFLVKKRFPDNDQTIYFQVLPQVEDWFILVMMGLLNKVNVMFNQKEDILKITELAEYSFQEQYKKTSYYFGRFVKISKSIMIYLVLILMIYMQIYIETNIINWVFFVLNTLSFALMIRAQTSVSAIDQQLRVANTIKFYSLIILVIDILFISFIGYDPNNNQPGNVYIRENYPWIHDNMVTIGLRSHQSFETEEQKQQVLKNQFVTYVVYFLLAIYLVNFFTEMRGVSLGDENFLEDDYQRLFQFEMTAHDAAQEIQDDDDDPNCEHVFEKMEVDLSNSVYKKKSHYTYRDLIDFYENKRFTGPFIIYRCMDWWPMLDFIATYGHVFNNLTIIIVAINYSVSFFMCFNVTCVCMFYCIATHKLNQKAEENFYNSGLQSQCDLKMAQIITKRYKSESFQVFLKLRRDFWRVQFAVLLLLVWISFPTSIILDIRGQFEKNGQEDALAGLDKISFWLFVTGIYKDGRKEYQYFYDYTYGSLILGLILERLAITWLKNRFGCTHNKLQKFIELDMRREALRRNWEVCPPPYGLERYRKHYFINDFDVLKEKFQINSEFKKLKDEFGNHLIGDFVPYKVGKRILKTIKFSVMLDCRAPEIPIDEQTKILLLNTNYDYETVPALRDYKIGWLETILKQAVDRKYKISLAKGAQIVFEVIMIMLLMTSLVLKSNSISFVYLIFVIKSVMTNRKSALLVRINIYSSIFLAIQYALYVLNLTQNTSPAPFPKGFDSYPENPDPNDLSIQFAIPFFFHYEEFRDLKIDYLLGIGIDKDQVQNLLIDFINLYVISMYILTFRNPILRKTMTKVFWQFPTPDDNDRWKKLHKQVQKQVQWLYSPVPLTYNLAGYKREESNFKDTILTKKQISKAENQYKFAKKYNNENKMDLNYLLTNYVDLKYQNIWSQDFLKKKKADIKANSTYYRIVKQGSILVYVTFHIFTIFIILLMATMRQSILSLGYVFILLPRVKDGAEVLNQKSIENAKKIQELEDEIKKKQKQIEALEEIEEKKWQKKQNEAPENEQNDANKKNKELEALDTELKNLNEQLKEITKNTKQVGGTFTQKQAEKKAKSQKQWPMIPVIKKWLLIYGLIDFILQIIIQMPQFRENDLFYTLGVRKIWVYDDDKDENYIFSYRNFIASQAYTIHYDSGLRLNWTNFAMQILNIFIIAMVMLQSEIFDSAGYFKFVTQDDGSMDLLLKLKELKGKSITYVFNNNKIRKILSIQRKRESIMGTVKKIKEKIIRWRQFTRTTLNDRLQLQQQVEEQQILDSQSPLTKNKSKDKRQSTVQTTQSNKPTVRFENQENLVLKKMRLSAEETDTIIKLLTAEFVQAKKEKLRASVRFYNWLNLTFTEQIMFKNNKEELEEIKARHASGEVNIPTELEKLMHLEGEEIIRQHYDHLDGGHKLALLMKSSKHSNQSLLQMTNIDKIIKLKQMQKTWEFTRTIPMIMRYIETFFYILISQTQNLIYVSMIMSMYQNAGIISLPYPIMVFGYALIEETRPKKEFWRGVRLYTTFILLFKFTLNLKIFDKLLETKEYVKISAYLKIGIYDYHSIPVLIMYMGPEILIICFIMLNEIKLKLLGLYFQTENEIETIQEAIQRNIENGDEEKVKQKKIERSNMCMARFFDTAANQLQRQKEYLQMLKDEVREELEWDTLEELNKRPGNSYEDKIEYEFEQRTKVENVKGQQESEFKSIAKSINKTSRKFDLDSTQKNSPYDVLVRTNVLQKSLETDNLIFVEGMRRTFQPDFLTEIQMEDEMNLEENWESLSTGDCKYQLDNQVEKIENRQSEKMGIFERSQYMENLFPSLKIQKPGYDLYGSTTSTLAILALYVFFCFQNYTVDPSSFVQGQSSIFKGDMAITLVIVIIIIIIERLASRTDTKKVEAKEINDGIQEAHQQYFSSEEMFKRTSTARSMTIAIKTMKTSDLDMQGSSAQSFLQQMYGNSESNDSIDESRTRITTQQKTKYILHWTILIAGHIYVFWYIPISGNIKLYETAECNYNRKENFGCRNFHENTALRILYMIILLYLTLSSLQLSYGFPIMKKPSSVLQYYNDLAKVGADIFYAIPFAVELRCLLDFTVSKTSLDMFQYFQLFSYHYELYACKIGNKWYTIKGLGTPVDRCEKCIFGVIVTGIVMVLMVGPFLLFSDLLPGLIAFNPVLSADVKLSFMLNETVFTNTTSHETLANVNVSQAELFEDALYTGEIIETNRTTPYLVYENKNPFFREYDDVTWQYSNFSNWTETLWMKPEQVQDLQANDFSDTRWEITSDSLFDLVNEFNKSLNMPQPNKMSNFSIQFDLDFERAQPLTAQKASMKFYKTLNYSRQPDCITGIQLTRLINLKCPQDDPNAHATVIIRQAYNPNIILGQDAIARQIDQKEVNFENQKHDLSFTYSPCDTTWSAFSKRYPTVYSEDDIFHQTVKDIETCELMYPKEGEEQLTLDEIIASVNARSNKEWHSQEWGRFQLTLFSFLVSASFLAAYNPTTFYSGIVYIASSTLRPVFIINLFMGFLYEVTNPDPLIKLVEACYIHRHEQNLVEEEETYRMLVEIVRSPELLKAMSGSSLKGECDPLLDKLDQKTKQKLLHLQKLEAKGFDVEKLKMRILNGEKQSDFDEID